MPKKFYIETVGCQMNVLDSELVVGALRRQGYELTHEPTAADVILFNTCSVRQHAEDKIYSALGRLRAHKRRHPDKVIGVLGCMAQNEQQKVLRRAPYVDIVCGTGQLARLPELIAAVERTGRPQFALSLERKEASRPEVERSFESYDPLRDPSMRPNHFQAYVRVQIGCDKFCTYCIVPRVRGPEQGRPPREAAVHGIQQAPRHGEQRGEGQQGRDDARRVEERTILAGCRHAGIRLSVWGRGWGPGRGGGEYTARFWVLPVLLTFLRVAHPAQTGNDRPDDQSALPVEDPGTVDAATTPGFCKGSAAPWDRTR